MPSSITAYYTFVATTKAKASEVNTNFSNYRGDLLPVNENTATASDGTHALGSEDHYWLRGFAENLRIRGASTDSYLEFQSDLAATAGAFNVVSAYNSNTVFQITHQGYGGTPLAGQGRRMQRKIISTPGSGTLTMPLDSSACVITMCGAGGGGGGGASNNGCGGGGGAGSTPHVFSVAYSAGLTITYGVAATASGGAGGSNTGATVGTGGSATSLVIGSYSLYVPGGVGGGQASTTAGSAGASYIVSNFAGLPVGQGGTGGAVATNGSGGYRNFYAETASSGGASGGGNGGGGGGGGPGMGPGGDGGGGAGASTGGNGSAPTTTAYGAGGGGGGGVVSPGFTGGNGGAGNPGVIFIDCVTSDSWAGTV